MVGESLTIRKSFSMPAENEGVVGPRTKRNFPFLYRLSKCRSAKKRWEMVQNASPDELMAIVDIGSNIAKDRFKLTAKERRYIETFRDPLKKLGRVRTRASALKAIQTGEGIVVNPKPRRSRDVYRVTQRGRGFLPAMLIPVLVELAAKGVDHLLPEPEHDDDDDEYETDEGIYED